MIALLFPNVKSKYLDNPIAKTTKIPPEYSLGNNKYN